MGSPSTERKKRRRARARAKSMMHDDLPACKARDKVLTITPIFPGERIYLTREHLEAIGILKRIRRLSRSAGDANSSDALRMCDGSSTETT